MVPMTLILKAVSEGVSPQTAENLANLRKDQLVTAAAEGDTEPAMAIAAE